MKRDLFMHVLLLIGTLGLFLGLAGVAHGEDDGGTRSIFAEGAGNRALGMGGAFTAIADDASGPLWNPGGLGLVERREFQASHTTLFGLDMNESFVALVVPSWRWGVASITFRRFGTDGIEGRDERNRVTDENLSMSEEEILLSYGRRFGDSWSLGGGLKVQRQTIAGLDASGIGGDVGLMVRPMTALGIDSDWSRPLIVGVSVRNAIEPQIRLESENVGDPTTLRLGTSYRHFFSRNSYLLASIDLEKAREISPQFAGGLELRLLPVLTLRTGLNRDVASAGAGVRLRSISFDYAFENNTLGEIHRFGLSYAFGRTVEESHLAALRAEEEAIQQRLTDAFEKRQRAQSARLLTDARASHQQGRHEEALETLAVLSTLSPDLPPARMIEIDCWRSKAKQLEQTGEFADAALAYHRILTLAPEDAGADEAIKRCRAESDRRAARSEELRERFSAALDAFSLGNLTAAREDFAAILEMEPEDHEAASMLERTESAITRRASDLLDQTDRLLRAGLLTDAVAMLRQVRTLSPNQPRLARAQTELGRLRKEADRARAEATSQPEHPSARDAEPTAEATVPVTADELSVKEQREVEDLYQRGLKAMEQNRPDAALRYMELVHSVAPNHGQVKEHLRREYLMNGMDFFANGRLDEAVDLWEKVLQIDPNDLKARGYLARAHQQLEKTREILGNH